MPSIINSDDGVVSGTSGLKTTGGNDGLLNIQSNGSTVVAVTGSGISVTGTVSQTGVSTFAAGTVSAPSITFTGDTNTGIFSPAADTIAFTEGGVESMRIDSSGRVGIGATPSAWASGNSVIDIGASGSLLGSNTGAGVVDLYYNNFFNGTNSIYKANGAASYYRQNTGAHVWNSAPSGTAGNAITFTQVLAVEKDKSLALQGATSQSGTGITFPATQSASSNANTLDDYEEGTWTPAFGTTGTAFSSITYSTQTGYYTKIGNMVYIWGWVTINTVSGGTGNITMTGLPFTNGSMQGGVTTNWADGQWTTRCPDAGHILTNSTTVYLIQYGGTQTLQIPVGNAKAGSQWIFDGAYGIV